MDSTERAQKAVKALWQGDQFSQRLGMSVQKVEEGYAQVQLKIEDWHCNGHKIAHGGLVFSLADTAAAFAANSRNHVTLSQHNMVTYLAPVCAGDILTAEAREVSLVGRNCICDVAVSNESGEIIAQFRGMMRRKSAAQFTE